MAWHFIVTYSKTSITEGDSKGNIRKCSLIKINFTKQSKKSTNNLPVHAWKATPLDKEKSFPLKPDNYTHSHTDTARTQSQPRSDSVSWDAVTPRNLKDHIFTSRIGLCHLDWKKGWSTSACPGAVGCWRSSSLKKLIALARAKDYGWEVGFYRQTMSLIGRTKTGIIAKVGRLRVLWACWWMLFPVGAG